MQAPGGLPLTYRSSRQSFAIWMTLGVAILAFGLWGVFDYARGSNAGLHGQYLVVVALGAGAIFRAVRPRLISPVSTTLTDAELICRFTGSERRTPIEDIAGVALVRRPLRAPIHTYHVWRPAYWLRDGELHETAGVLSYHGSFPSRDVLTTRSGQVARDLYQKLVGLQGANGPIRMSRLGPIPGAYEAIIELGGENGDHIARWDAGFRHAYEDNL